MECRREPVLMTYFRGRWEARCSYLRFAQPCRRYPGRRDTVFPAPLNTRWVPGVDSGIPNKSTQCEVFRRGSKDRAALEKT